jgi:hypothetical protein
MRVARGSTPRAVPTLGRRLHAWALPHLLASTRASAESAKGHCLSISLLARVTALVGSSGPLALPRVACHPVYALAGFGISWRKVEFPLSRVWLERRWCCVHLRLICPVTCLESASSRTGPLLRVQRPDSSPTGASTWACSTLRPKRRRDASTCARVLTAPNPPPQPNLAARTRRTSAAPTPERCPVRLRSGILQRRGARPGPVPGGPSPRTSAGRGPHRVRPVPLRQPTRQRAQARRHWAR